MSKGQWGQLERTAERSRIEREREREEKGGEREREGDGDKKGQVELFHRYLPYEQRLELGNRDQHNNKSTWTMVL